MQNKLTEAPVQEPLTERQTGLHQQSRDPQRKRSAKGWIWLLLFLAACAAGVFVWRSTHKTAAGARQTAGAGQGAGRRNVPVVVATALKQDLPVYLDGLGNVEAYNTVTVKSRVDGQLVQVNFKEGQDVQKGQLLAVIDTRPFEVALSQAEATFARDQSQMGDANLNLQRFEQLAKQGVISQQQYDTQHALVGQLQGSIRADQAQIESAKLQLTYSHIIAPISGRVGLRLVDQGNMVHASDPNGLLVITQMEPISVIFTLPEDSLPAVAKRMRQGKLPVIAMSRDGSAEIARGTLETMDNQIDQTTGTIKLKAVFDNKDRALWPNQFVNARLLLDVRKNAITVPAAAVQTGSQGTFVYVVKQDKTVDVRAVSVGLTEGTIVAIDKGLAPGEQVVTDGQEGLRAGSSVEPRTDSRPGAGGRGRGNREGGGGNQGAPGARGQNGSRGNGPSADGQTVGGQAGNAPASETGDLPGPPPAGGAESGAGPASTGEPAQGRRGRGGQGAQGSGERQQGGQPNRPNSQFARPRT